MEEEEEGSVITVRYLERQTEQMEGKKRITQRHNEYFLSSHSQAEKQIHEAEQNKGLMNSN